ncbi:MAG: precorrin-3B C(17)-methyltransferase [Thainema sp.]
MTLDKFQPLAAIAVTPAGIQRLSPVCRGAEIPLFTSSELAASEAFPVQAYEADSLRSHLANIWSDYRGFVFCLSTGAVVRLIAPLLEHKSTDPAVVVVDEAGQFVISLCGGHQGGADQLTQVLAHQLQAAPVLTGAANAQGFPAVDTLGEPFGWQRGSGNWTQVSAVAARGGQIEVLQEAGTDLWRTNLSDPHPFQFSDEVNSADSSSPEASDSEPLSTKPQARKPQARLWISPVQRRFAPDSDPPKAQWHPRVLWVGIGCERGTSQALIETAIAEVCRVNHLSQYAIAGVATIDLKADEIGLIDTCRANQWPLRCFSAEDLKQIEVPTPSDVVEQAVGTPSVAEAAAIAAARYPVGQWVPTPNAPGDDTPQNNGHPDQAQGSAAWLRVKKQIVRDPDQPGAVTVAIAQAEQEYTGRSGALWLIGTGPGALEQITPAAQAAIAAADAIVGYSMYIDLIRPLLRPGQLIEARAITQERQRAQRAIELAQWGLSVAVVSSGDCGIYGMAGLVMEELQQMGWDGKTPALQVFPGISALQSAASRVGAPLMHDFCAISLSDLLTPWPVIEQRLQAAAAADFVVALYNPRSQKRTSQIETAQHIFLQHRPATTPVALVRSAYREDEAITLTTLADFAQCPIDMVTTVLIGNSSTRHHADWLITPRGYLGFQSPNSEPAESVPKKIPK